MKIRAAVLPATGQRLEIAELDLAPPNAQEVLVRLAWSGVCHSDQNAIDGTTETPVSYTHLTLPTIYSV